MLAIRVAGLDFPNPVGLAAGFDKDARGVPAMLGFGFGFVEVGHADSAAAGGQSEAAPVPARRGPRGDQPHGLQQSAAGGGAGRLARRDRPQAMVGINVGANKDSADRDRRLCRRLRAMAPLADYLTVNISSPNTPGLRALQDKGALDAARRGDRGARRRAAGIPQGRARPGARRTWTTSPGSRSPADRRADRLQHHDLPAAAALQPSGEAGGLSGAPLKALALQRLSDFRARPAGRCR